MVQLMDLSLLLLILATVSAKFPEIEKDDDKVIAATKSVYQTWDAKKEANVDDTAWGNAESVTGKRQRRNARDAGGTAYCEAGYTGENCEFPICKETNTQALSHPTGGPVSVPIDIGYFASCNVSMLTVIDTLLRGLTITVTTNPSEFPQVRLIDSSGQEITATGVQGIIWTYGQQKPGLYTIRIEAPLLDCYVSVAGPSTLQIQGGFVRNAGAVASDRVDTPNEEAYYLEPSTFIVHAYGLTRPGQVVSVTVFQQYNTVARPQTLLKRYGCAYEYFVETFFCRDTRAKYYYRIDGIDFSGNRFRRLGTFSCVEAPPTSPVPTTVPDPGPRGCRNGGILLNNTDGTRYCYCQGYFSGRDCGSNMCLNGGTRTSGPVCMCPKGFTGTHCENVQCPDRAGAGFGTDRPVLTFVVRAQLGLKGVIAQVATQIRNIYGQLQFDPAYLQSFGLLLFSRNNFVPGWDTYSSVDDLINALLNAPLDNRTSCTDIVLTSIAEAISTLALHNRSPVYVITDAVPNDEDQGETIFHLNTYRGSPIYVLYLEPTVESGCTMDVYHTGYQALLDVTKRTSGHVFNVPNTQMSRAGELFYAHAQHTLYRSSLISSTDSANCGSRPKFVPIRIDRSIRTIVITATGRDTYLSLTSEGSTPPPSTANYTLGDVQFWWYENLNVGTWGISIRSYNANSGPCSARVYSTRISSQERTEYDLFWAYTDVLTNDAPFVQPVIGEPFALVAHVNNYNVLNPSKVFAEVVVARELDNGAQEQVYLSNGLWRNECDFQLYFPPMSCHIPNELLYISVYIRDEMGFMFQRAGVSYCSVAQPTLEPPSDCLHGGVPLTTAGNATVCYCTADWTGKKCEIPVCHNGGTLQQAGGGSSCDCPAGYVGLFCETSYCTDQAPDVTLTPMNRDMAFVVELTTTSANAVKQLSDYIGGIVREINLHRNEWIANYILVAYNSSSSQIIGVYRRNQVERFIAAVKDMYNNAFNQSTQVDSGCQVHVWEALQTTMDFIRAEAFVNLFHASAPYQATLPYVAATTMLYNKRIVLNTFYVVGNNKWLCNATDDDYKRINALSEANGGRAYPVQSSSFLEVLKMIPSYHMSSLVYMRKFDDCTTSPQTVYFPVDSYTQSIQLNIRGYNNHINIYRPDGTQPAEGDFYDLFEDVKGSAWRITQVRQPCDRGWVQLGKEYCVLLVNPTKAMSWTAASTQCHAAGGFLVDVSLRETSEWIDANAGGTTNAMWIGLNRIGQQNLNDFYWDAPTGMDPIKLGPNDWTKWATGEPTTDPDKRCILRGTDGTWSTQNCTDTYSFICQKHKYDADFEPNIINDDDLPNGKWWVTVKTDTPPQGYVWNYSSCLVEVRVQSAILLFPAYTLSEHSTIPDYEPATGSKNNHIMASIFGGSSDAILSYAHIYDFDTLAMKVSATYQKRIVCKYPWLSQTWTCDTPNQQFAVIHMGEDQNGANFQRMTTGICPNQVANCGHGVSAAGICLCDDYWTGKLCDTPLCVNNGQLDQATKTCNCVQGYTGTSCQYPQCLPQVPHTFSIEQKTLGLVLEMTLANKAAVQKLADNFASMMQQVTATHPNWINRYVVTYINSTTFLTTFSNANINQIVPHIQQQIAKIVDPGTTCGAPLFGGLAAILSSSGVQTEGSMIFVVTRSTATDAATNIDSFLTALTIKKAQLNYLVVDDTEKVCGLAADNDAVKNLSIIALATGGDFFILPSARFTTFMGTYLVALHSTTLLTTPTLTNMTCVGAHWFAQVDYDMDYMYVTMFAPPGTMSYIYNPRGEQEVDMEKLYVQGYTSFVRVNTQQKPGMYTIRVHGGAPCSVQIRGSSPVNVWAGFIQPGLGGDGSHMDNVTADPVQDWPNTINLHVSNVTIGRLTYTELLNPYDGSIVVSQLYRRANCSYEYYSNEFDCPDSNFLIMVNGIDDYGQNFRREVGVAHCYNATVPTTSTVF